MSLGEAPQVQQLATRHDQVTDAQAERWATQGQTAADGARTWIPRHACNVGAVT